MPGGWNCDVTLDATTAVLSSEAFALSSPYLAGALLVPMTALILVVPCTSKALLSHETLRTRRARADDADVRHPFVLSVLFKNS